MGTLNENGVINLKAAKEAIRINDIINRLDDRGTELICKAIENRADRAAYERYMAGIEVVSKRCQKMAAYINGLSRPKRRSA